MILVLFGLALVKRLWTQRKRDNTKHDNTGPPQSRDGSVHETVISVGKKWLNHVLRRK